MSIAAEAYFKAPTKITSAAILIGELWGMRVFSRVQAERMTDHLAEVYRADMALAGADPIPPRCCHVQGELFDTMRAAARRTNLEYEAQIDELRKAVGPALARGAEKADVAVQARQLGPLILPDHLTAILDEESAWWLRWRHDRAFREQMAEAA